MQFTGPFVTGCAGIYASIWKNIGGVSTVPAAKAAIAGQTPEKKPLYLASYHMEGSAPTLTLLHGESLWLLNVCFLLKQNIVDCIVHSDG